ncbi:hypothetical protein GCM10025785_13760 [Corynebacterium canis]
MGGPPLAVGARGQAAENRGKRLFTKNTGPCEDDKSRYTD